jgi:hypothetical protein
MGPLMGLVGGSTCFFFIRVPSVDQIFVLDFWMLLIVTSQRLNQCLIHYFYMCIYLLMEHYKYLHLGIHLIPKYSRKGLRNCVFVSEMMFLGIPKCTQYFSTYMIFASCPLMIFLLVTRMNILLNLPTTTHK